MATVSFAEWRPDVAMLNSSYAADVLNVLCADGSYIPFPQLEVYSTAMASTPFGAFSARDSAGQIVIFAGTATKLYKLNTTTLEWDHVSRLAANQITNGTFDADTDWTKGTNVTIASGVGTFTATPDGQAFSQSQTLTAGKIYKVVFTVSAYTSGGVRALFTGGTSVVGTTRTALGTYTEYLTAATGNITLAIAAVGTSTLSVDNVTVQELATYSASADDRWRFAQFGDFVIAVNANDPPQVYEIGTSTEFADLGGSPPRARYVAVWGDFLALGGLTDNPNRVHWSALNDITGWTPGTNNSDYQDFPDGGDVMGMNDATNPIIFQKAAIRLGTFVPGSAEIFTFQKIHDKRGSAAPYAIASRGSFTFFADAGGFFQIAADGSIAPIGFEKVDRTVFGNIDGAELAGIIGEVDPFYARVYWAVKYDSTTDAFDRLIVYDWNLQKWSQIGGSFEILFPLASGTIGYTLSGLDAVSATLSGLPFPLGSKVWQGGAPIMAAFDTDNKLGFFSGGASQATLTTQEMGSTGAEVQRVKDITPIIDAEDLAGLFVSIGARLRRSDPVVWSAEATPSTNTGVVRKKSRARFHQFKLRVAADSVWNHAQGLDVISEPAGLR